MTRTISIKKTYARDWERLMKVGTLETDGNTARYFGQVLAARQCNDMLQCFRNEKTKRSILMFDRKMVKTKKRVFWNRVRFYLTF